MAYRYSAYTHDKKTVQGIIDATSESAAEEALYRAGYYLVVTLKEVRHTAGLARLLPTFYGVKSQDVIDFSRQLATLVGSGISLLTALRLLQRQAAKAALKEVIARLIAELQGGSTFSQALGKYPSVFSHTYRQMIEASEQTGRLDSGLRQITEYLEKRLAIRRKTSRAMAYPALVLVVASGVFALLITVALPPLVALFTSLGAELPWTTKAVIALADLLTKYKLHLLGGALGLITLISIYLRLPAGKLTVDRLLLSMPVIGDINVQRNMGYFCRTTSMLLKAGLRLPEIIDIASQTMGNRVIRQALSKVREKLVQGQGMSQPMAEISLFPGLMVEMVVVGENTGTMDSTLETVADFYEQSAEQRVQMLTALIEPLLTIVVGLVVIFIALSMITPLYSILKSVP